MGGVNATAKSSLVMPEVLCFSGGKLLLVHGEEGGREFWWPPGAYWLSAKACDLTAEQPEAWIQRTVQAQIGVAPLAVRLRSVEFIDRQHPPILVYDVDISGGLTPGTEYGFDKADYFDVHALPANLGRDSRHGEWLRGLVNDRTTP